MQIKRMFLLMALAITGLFVLAACATGTEESSTPSPVPPTEVAQVEEEAVEEEVAEEVTEEEAVDETATTEEEVVEEEVAEEVTEEEAVEEEVVEEEVAEEVTEEEAVEEEMVEEEVVEEMVVEEMTEDAVVSRFAGSITSVCLVTDLGRVNDGSFNQSAYDGMVRAVEDFNLDSTFIETQSQADYVQNINICIDEGFGAIVTVGFLIADATFDAAVANPNVFFLGVDQFHADAPENLVGIQFREDQAGFLAGVMAALMTETGKIGGIYGEEIPPVVKFRNGFEQGARFINPDIEILGVYIGSFIDAAAGAEAAENFIGEGVDVIFGAGGPTGSGGILRAAEQGVKVIGVDQDEFFTTFGAGETPGAENIITSAIKRVDQGVYDMLNALTVGTVDWPVGGIYLMDAVVEGVGFAPANLAEVPEEVTAQVQAALDALAAGELETGVDPITGALLGAEE